MPMPAAAAEAAVGPGIGPGAPAMPICVAAEPMGGPPGMTPMNVAAELGGGPAIPICVAAEGGMPDMPAMPIWVCAEPIGAPIGLPGYGPGGMAPHCCCCCCCCCCCWRLRRSSSSFWRSMSTCCFSASSFSRVCCSQAACCCCWLAMCSWRFAISISRRACCSSFSCIWRCSSSWRRRSSSCHCCFRRASSLFMFSIHCCSSRLRRSRRSCSSLAMRCCSSCSCRSSCARTAASTSAARWASASAESTEVAFSMPGCLLKRLATNARFSFSFACTMSCGERNCRQFRRWAFSSTSSALRVASCSCRPCRPQSCGFSWCMSVVYTTPSCRSVERFVILRGQPAWRRW
mmetsp:Transcript_20417/g.78289  ORF Transcript_20417/g.78289 Transcript_20417/m.78289 type:complete len:347 (+) Transcript_20417:132-1172(+)